MIKKENFNGGRIYEKRVEQGLTLTDLAKLMGVGATSISFWERGVNVPSVRHLNKLSHVLKTDIRYFFDKTNNE